MKSYFSYGQKAAQRNTGRKFWDQRHAVNISVERVVSFISKSNTGNTVR